MKKVLLVFYVLVCAALPLLAQTVEVSGVVVDEHNEPVTGAAVRLEGNSKGTITDINGRFRLQGITKGQRITVSFMGMTTRTLVGKPNMRVVLESHDAELDEVMVVAFGEQSRASFTGSAAVVDAKTIEHKQLTNVLSGLQGEAAGVQMINNSGSPTATPTLRIRGFSSLNSGQDPLIIVDGAPYDGGWNNLNPNDVASISVLKDAASNALYGARGANGVIMITTKKAKAGEATVTLDAKWGSNSRIERDYELIDNPGQYYETYYKAIYNYQVHEWGLSAYDAHVKANSILMSGVTTGGGLGYLCYTVPNGEYLIGENGRLNPHATLGNRVYNNGQYYTIMPDDWKGAAYRNGLRQEYNVNVTGGNERAQFYASVGYLGNEGIAPNSDFTRYSARLKADYEAKRWLKLGGNVNFTRSDYNNVLDGDASGLFNTVNTMAPIYPVYIRDGNGRIMTDERGRMYDYGEGKVTGIHRPNLPQNNPLQENLLNTQHFIENMFSGTGYVDIRLYEGLKFTANATINLLNQQGTYTQQPFYGYGSVAYPTGEVTKNSADTYSYNLQQLLSYQRDLGLHHFDVLAGHEYYRNSYDYLTGTRDNMAAYFDNQNLSGAVKVIDAADNNTVYNNEGWLLRGQYDYAQKYFGSISYRRDASSYFHPDHRWGNFFSFGTAWLLSKEKWLADVKWIDHLKIKASFGQQGNDKLPGSYLYGNTYAIQNNEGLAITLNSVGNPDITWETNNNFNVGVEFELLKKRLRGGVDYFYRKTTDMLSFVYAPYSMGYSGSWFNVGDMLNSGVEVSLSGDVIKTRNLVWTLNLNATHYRNEVDMLSDDLVSKTPVEGHRGYTAGNYYVGEGLPIYTWYLKRYAGVSDKGESMWYERKADGTLGTTTQYGDADFFLCGDTHPVLYGGFGTSLSYAGFDLSVVFSYSIGGKAYDYGYAQLMTNPYADLTGMALHQDILNAWTPENTGSDIPRWQYGDSYSASMSDRFLTNASYLTLQNINVGYTLPTKWVSKLRLQGIRVYMAGDNLYYWSKRKGFDPRGSFNGMTDATGYDSYLTYPSSRCISGGINIRF